MNDEDTREVDKSLADDWAAIIRRFVRIEERALLEIEVRRLREEVEALKAAKR